MTTKFARLLSILAITLVTSIAAPPDAKAISEVSIEASNEAIFKCRAKGYYEWYCQSIGNLVDPSGTDVTSVTMSMAYNPSLLTFDQAESGPLGMFSMGGSAPPANAGFGTQPVMLQPSTGFSPGSPLPGSTLTYTQSSGLVSIDYQFASPITVTGDTNFFYFAFDFVNPVTINLSASTVSYAAEGPGTALSVTSFACTTTNLANICGSNTPSTGVSFNLVPAPEPGTLSLVLVALGGLGALRTRRWREANLSAQ
jgi:PEP-CTERM motif